jgi:hypothetical protein
LPQFRVFCEQAEGFDKAHHQAPRGFWTSAHCVPGPWRCSSSSPISRAMLPHCPPISLPCSDLRRASIACANSASRTQANKDFVVPGGCWNGPVPRRDGSSRKTAQHRGPEGHGYCLISQTSDT